MRHSGVGFPNGAVDNAAVFALPSPDLLMLSTEGRWHHDAAVRAGKRVLWRAIPRIGKRPAELGWSPSRFVAETINLTDAPTLPITDFIPWNELDLQDERGDLEDDWSNLERRYALIGGWALSVVQSLKQWSPSTRIHFGAWTPDHYALDHVTRWMEAARNCDVIDFHAYDSLANIKSAYHAYRNEFSDKPLALTEWHCRGDLDEERRVLAWLAETMAADPLFEAAHFFIWRWHNAPGWWDDHWDIEHNPERLALFADPPTGSVFPPSDEEPEPEPVPQEPAMPDPWEHFPADAIAAAAECPLENVAEHWPRLVEQLGHCGINERLVQIGLIGTIAKESASTFAPVREAFYLGEPEPAESHRRTLSYYPYYGRGHIQLTHAGNYTSYGRKVAALWQANPSHPDFDLVGNPDRALDPDISAAVAALYFRDTKTIQGYTLVDACRAQDWEWVRRLVLGGPDPEGAARIARIAAALVGATPMPTVRFDPSTPPIRQNDSWSCAPTSARWAMTALGRHPSEQWFEDTMLAEGVVTREHGLMDASGAGLAAFIRRHYGEFGYEANHEPSVSFDWAASEGDHAYPVLLGGRGWNHWAVLTGFNGSNLLLMNPAGTWMGVGSSISRANFDALGPFSAVRIWHPDLLGAAPPVPPPPPADTRLERALAQAREVVKILEEARP